MATGKRYYWIKLKESFFADDGPVDFMMNQPDGANYVVLYQMLCLKTINTEGWLSRQIGEVLFQYDINKIQQTCRYFSKDTIRVALNLYKALGLIYEEVNGTLVIANHHDIVGSETDWAAKKRGQREQPALPETPPPALPEGEHSGEPASGESGDNVPTDVPIRDKEIRDIDIRSNKSLESGDSLSAPQASRAECPFAKIRDLYHEICISFPRIVSIEGNRRKAVAARWRAKPDLETFRTLFTLAEQSSFLKGRNDRNWSADFDWMMKASNFDKILEHRYDDRPGKQAGVFGTLAQMYEEAGYDEAGNG